MRSVIPTSPTGSDGFAFGEVDEPCLAKVFAGVVAGFGDAIGVQDQPVVGLQNDDFAERSTNCFVDGAGLVERPWPSGRVLR